MKAFLSGRLWVGAALLACLGFGGLQASPAHAQGIDDAVLVTQADDMLPPGGPNAENPNKRQRGGRMMEQLGLTEAQRTQLQQIRSDMKARHQALKAETESRLRTVLTADQMAKLEQLKAQRKGQGRRHRMNNPNNPNNPNNAGQITPGNAPSVAPGQTPSGVAPGERKGRLAQELGLNEQQMQQLKTIMQEQGQKRKALHAEMKTRLNAVLTPEQQQKLEQFKQQRGQGKRNRVRPNNNF